MKFAKTLTILTFLPFLVLAVMAGTIFALVHATFDVIVRIWSRP